jgi:hypothetical protein
MLLGEFIMDARGRYYLSRIIKLGQLNQDNLIRAMMKPASIVTGKYAWTLTDVRVFERNKKIMYVFGKLSKYNPEGSVRVVNEREKAETSVVEPNLIEASSPFIYIPEFSGLAYLHVWNRIERETFAKRFSRIIEESFENFFVECKIEPITDLRKFIEKLASIDTFTEISAKVHPPNPLFGRAWQNLREYLEKRQASELSLKEVGDEKKPLNSHLETHVRGLVDQTDKERYFPSEPVDITDAAILMAVDGYGDGRIVGRERETRSTVILKVSEKHVSFLFEADPSPDQLFEEAHKQFRKISNERIMDHP